MGRIKLILVCFLTTATLMVRGQNQVWASYEVFGEKEGFQTYYGPGQITCDKDGLLWIGGDNGLFSFDGTHFTNYRNIAGNDSSLPFNTVSLNYQDKDGVYWLSVTNKGLYNFNPLTRSFRQFIYPGMDRFNLHQYRINNFLEDGSRLWMIMPDFGLACWDKATSVMTPYRICPPNNCGSYYSASWVTTMIKDSANNCYWIGSNGGLIQFWPATGDYKVYNPHREQLASNVGQMKTIVNFLLPDKDGVLWCGTWGLGVLAFDRNSKIFKSYPWKPVTGGTQNICSGLFVAGANQLWVASLENGLMLFDKRSGKYRPVRSPEKPDEIIGAVNCYKGKHNTLWVADAKRLYRYNLDTTRFAWYPTLGPRNDEQLSGGMFSFLASNNKLYAGIYYDGNFGWYDHATYRFVPRPLTPEKDNEGVRHLSMDPDGVIWVGTPSGAYLYQPQTDQRIIPKKIANSDRYFTSFCHDVLHNEDGSHWLAADDAVILYDPRRSRLTVLDATQPSGHKLSYENMLDLFKDSKGRIWIGGIGNHVACYIPEKDSVVHVKMDFLTTRDNSSAFCEDKDGNILFALFTLGLVVIEHPFTSQQKMTLCNTGNYLPTDRVNSILRDEKDRIWLLTSNGLLLFDPVTKKYTSFQRKHGLYDNFIDSYAYQDSAGFAYVGFSEGFQTFQPDSLIAQHTGKVTMRLNNLSVDGSIWPQHPAYTNNISIPPNLGNLSFSFAALGWASPDNFRYAYMLEGYDKNWHYTNSPTGQYNNLPPGDYVLRIKAATQNDQWISEQFGLPIIVQPAWYQATWFKILLGLLVAAIIFGGFSYRLHQVRREAVLKENFNKKINELEMRSLRAQMNPHFIFNSLSSINRYIVKSDHRTASNYLTKFSKLIRMILDNSALDVISVEKELQTLQLYIDMEELRFDHAFTHKIEVDESIDEEETYIPSMLLQPYVENAIWHGLMHKEEGGGRLSIKLTLLSPTLLVAIIEDNGIGRKKAIALKSKEALKKKSYGMQISHDRLELLNRQKQESSAVLIEDVVNEEGSVSGTRVILHIPIQNKT